MKRRNRRRGVSLLLVLGLIAIALATSYALLRTQATAMQLQGNSDRQVDARQAALAGLSAAMRKMHEPDWLGVDVPLRGNLGPNEWYEVSYVTGDTALKTSDADFAEFPFRVTITAIGYAVDPKRPDAQATHRTSAVVQLVRRKLAAEPGNWAELQNYTIYQWANSNAYIQVPVRVEGPVLMQGPIQLCVDYPSTTSSRKQYLGDLELQRAAGLGDNRPFNGPLTVQRWRSTNETRDLLRQELNLTLKDSTASDGPPLASPGLVRTYRLYPGGKTYTISTIQSQFGASLANLTLAPDPKTNPLGLFPSDGSLTLNDNVKIEGTLFAGGTTSDLRIYGKNVVLKARDIPAIYASANRVQLPAVLVGDDLRVYDQAHGSLAGLAVVWDAFEFQKGGAATAFDMQGRLLTSELRLLGRNAWTYDPATWGILLFLFQQQINHSSRILYFPQWPQANFNLLTKPLLTIRPDSSGVAYHWQDWSQPVYSAHPDDGGLRWDLVRWKDNPR